MARSCVLAGWRLYNSRAIKGDTFSSVNIVRQFTFNLYSMIHVYSGCQ